MNSNLFNQIKSLVQDDYEISFGRDIMQLSIEVKKEINGIVFKNKQLIPIQNHFYQEKVEDCIDFCKNKIDQEISTKTNTNKYDFEQDEIV